MTLQVNYSFYDAQNEESVIPNNVRKEKKTNLCEFLRDLKQFTKMNETFDLSG